MKQISFKNKLGVGGIFVLAIIPVVFWILMRPFADRFFGFSATMTSIGQLTGLVGMTLFAESLILSARYKRLEKYFRGLNRIYINHHVVGGIAFILLLIHPIVIAIRILPVSLRAAAIFLLPSLSNPVKLYGIISLLLMIVLLALTFYFRPKYHIWKFTHKFLGLAFFIAGLHVFFVSSDVSRNTGLRFYILGLAVVALFSLLYRTIFPRFFVKKFEYKVASVKAVGPSLVEIEMAPKDALMPYQAGQFALFSFLDPRVGREEHPFSLASSPKDNNIKIVVKALGDYTQRLKNLSTGSDVVIEGAFGQFNFLRFPKEQVWIAGGIGITPFLGMARDLASGLDYKITLYYCAKTEDEMMFFNELMDIAAKNNNFKAIGFCQNKEGFLTADAIRATSGDFLGKDILLCGPPVMMSSLRKQLVSAGLSDKNIHSEEFEF